MCVLLLAAGGNRGAGEGFARAHVRTQTRVRREWTERECVERTDARAKAKVREAECEGQNCMRGSVHGSWKNKRRGLELYAKERLPYCFLLSRDVDVDGSEDFL